MLAQLTIPGDAPCPVLPWLEESQEDPKAFLAGLLAEHATLAPRRPKSRAFEHYDFFHDLVTRNVFEERAAFRWLDAQEGWQTLTYAELDGACAGRAASWARHGLAEGQTIALVHPPGPELVVALLSALRLGLVVSFLPPMGGRWLRARLDALGPDHVATDELRAPLLGEHRARAIPHDLPAAGAHEGSAVYATGAPVAQLFSPFVKDGRAPIPLGADEGYLFALRDGLLAFGLRPGDALAAPGLHSLQHQPSLLLSTLLAGGTYVHFSLEDVGRDPGILADLKLRSIGVAPRLRDLLLEERLDLGKTWEHWWRSVGEDADLPRWHEFACACGLRAVPCSNVLVDAAAGGCRFFSARRIPKQGGATSFVLPSAGEPWSLVGLGPKAPPTQARLGVFRSTRPGPGGDHLVACQRNELHYVGPSSPARQGRVYPADEVVACARDLPFVEDVLVVADATGDSSRPYAFALLAFVGASARGSLATDGDDWRRALEDTLRRELGPELVPDRVEVFPFSARHAKGQLDEVWCRDQWRSGRLHERVTRDLYVRLDELRAAVTGRPSGADSEQTSDATGRG